MNNIFINEYEYNEEEFDSDNNTKEKDTNKKETNNTNKKDDKETNTNKKEEKETNKKEEKEEKKEDKEIIEVFPPIHSRLGKNKKIKRVIVLDFDETLGSFSHLYFLWKISIKLYPEKGERAILFSLMDVYPEFLRVGILVILEYLCHKKKQGECYKVFLYTNNQCPVDWIHHVIAYFHHKLGGGAEFILFDQIIYAFKIGNQIVNTQRTTQLKTYSDFIQCSMLSKHAEICFIDDLYHPLMYNTNNKVYYIKPKAYNHHLSTNDIFDRFCEFIRRDNIQKISLRDIKNELAQYPVIKSSKEEKKIDILVSQKIMYYIREFFLIMPLKSNSSRQTIKRSSRTNASSKFTRKSY